MTNFETGQLNGNFQFGGSAVTSIKGTAVEHRSHSSAGANCFFSLANFLSATKSTKSSAFTLMGLIMHSTQIIEISHS